MSGQQIVAPKEESNAVGGQAEEAAAAVGSQMLPNESSACWW